MKIITFNIWGVRGPDPEKRWAYAGECLAVLAPDILCLQEAFHDTLLEGLARKTGLKIVRSDTDVGSGLAVLSRFAGRAGGLHTYAAKSSEENYVRKFLWTELEAGGALLLVTNTHLSWKAADDPVRQKQAEELESFVSARGLPAVLCGDFNCEYASAPMDAFRKDGYRDLMEGMPDAGRHSWDNANPHIQTHTVKFPDRRIDLVLANALFRERYTPETTRIVLDEPSPEGLFASDHYGVLAEF